MSWWGPRRIAGPAVVALVLGLLALVAEPVGAQGPVGPQDPTVTTAPIPPPAASIVVDAETGEVITAANERELLSPASTTKILTALLARDRLGLDDEITISETAADAPPRRIRLRAGTQWRVEDLLYATMLCSCNDAAWALGQAAGGGTMAGFASQAARLAERLGLEDAPVLRDPAGLDNNTSIGGGNLLSARDLAIAARAYLADPVLAAIAAAPDHRWAGGDAKPHSVTNLNRFVSAYEGAIGLKTGFTKRAGMTFVGAARRGGRTLIAVVLRSDNHYAATRALLDSAFLLASADEGRNDVLPALPAPPGADGSNPTSTTEPTTTTSTVVSGSGSEPPATAAIATEGTERDEVAAPPVLAPDERADERPVDPVWLGAGSGAVVAAVGVTTMAVRRTNRGRIDRRPARSRRRDRRRQRGRRRGRRSSVG